MYSYELWQRVDWRILQEMALTCHLIHFILIFFKIGLYCCLLLILLKPTFKNIFSLFPNFCVGFKKKPGLRRRNFYQTEFLHICQSPLFEPCKLISLIETNKLLTRKFRTGITLLKIWTYSLVEPLIIERITMESCRISSKPPPPGRIPSMSTSIYCFMKTTSMFL